MRAEILIVDDNTDIRNIINELIIDAGYKTRIAANYNQALTEIDRKLPDVAILDVKLDKGDNDGIELLSHIKTKNKDVPVIIISGHANIEMAIKSLQHGAFEFIEKPFDQERLLNFVSRAVENYDLKKQNKEYENKLFSSYDIIGDSKNTINITVECGRGTYIRSLAKDIASQLGTVGYLQKLKRTKIGNINRNACLTIDEFPKWLSSEILKK